MKLRKHTYSGTRSQTVTGRELRNKKLARQAAAEGIVLLKNNGILPLAEGSSVALYGSGALYTVKGGTGSGDVNERHVVSIYEGMKNAGFHISNEAWLNSYRSEYDRSRETWKQVVLESAGRREARGQNQHRAFVDAYVSHPFAAPVGRKPDMANAEGACAFYILSRQAGEGADRHAKKGDYYISDEELALLKQISGLYQNLVLVINSGGPVDLQFTKTLHLDAIIHISQPGMEGGNAFADVVGGVVTPCGKMTDTWAKRYEDYPNALIFSHCNGNVDQELYQEGIYVGYRYFDTFGVEPEIPFGFGLSYTSFCIAAKDVYVDSDKVRVRVEVRNTGTKYAGKEVVQVYGSCPQGHLKKEYQRLCAFGKTPGLDPGKSCTLDLTFPVFQLASFSQEQRCYLLEKGEYVLSVGNSSAFHEQVCVLSIPQDVRMLEVDGICPIRAELEEIEPESVPRKIREDIPVIRLDVEQIPQIKAKYPAPTPEKISGPEGEFVETLDLEQLLSLTSGDPVKGHGSSDTFGSSGLTVPGAAGETHCCALEQPWNLASIVLADGPAGLRLTPKYPVTADGKIIKPTFRDSMERGFFSTQKEIPDAVWYHQYCTGLPVGTMIAQSWNTELIREIGRAIGEELVEFGITLWLAPGLNIHRNPLCGRNFEYFSEDPLVSGVVAAAMTEGVQSWPGVGVTVKHLACNNQEDNRKGSDSVVSERALREIYLHGFSIVIRHSQPMAVMPSYNLINGVHAANSYDLLTKVCRGEWGFQGMFVSDWTTTGVGGACPVQCMRAGTDLIMPGSLEDIALIREALESGELDIREVKKSVANMVRIIRQSLEYEDCKPYSTQFAELEPYMSCNYGG